MRRWIGSRGMWGKRMGDHRIIVADVLDGLGQLDDVIESPLFAVIND